ncbi:MAG: chromosome segregation protein SMC [Ruminococcaceae bacterium]|nr:chromosome segregation protein SMC [Oscillospiraceae bacterium]
MYLKSLEVQGFKSFPDKTKLTFEGGTTVIVGPNGSGKSNISDAMRWVLGELSSKSLRSTKMEDIIFGGADSRRPMGYAEVSVTFDNTGMIGRLDCPYDEVTVTRRYYRSGESEYYINRRAVRLRDIYELFMNTGVGRDGYSVIGQGRIADIISKKSDERRGIFEDASGIAKYRHKKSECERKLAATEDNMTRINDIFVEVESQVIPLEKEAAKAKKAIELLETKKQVDVQLWLYDTEKLRTDIDKVESLFAQAEFELNTVDDSIKALETQNERLFEISQSNKAESESLLMQIRSQTEVIHRLESEYGIADNNISYTVEMIANAEGSRESSKRSLENEERSELERTQKIENLNLSLSQKLAEKDECDTERLSLASKADSIGDDIACALDEIHSLEAEKAAVSARISFIDNSKNSELDKNAAMLKEIADYEELSATFQKQAQMIKATIDEYDTASAEAQADFDKTADALDKLYEEQDTVSTERSSLSLRVDSISQRIDTIKSMEQQLEGYSGTVRYVMSRYAEGGITDRYGNKSGKIYGPLSQLISVDDKYVTAIETALAANIQFIVVEDEEVAKAAIATLKRENAGRTTFFPISSMSGQTVTAEMREASGYVGYIGIADELVTVDKKFSNVLSSLLGRTLVFDTLDNASAMSKKVGNKVKVVTLDGQIINAGGSYTGGSIKKGSNILGRAGEIKRLESEKSELDAKVLNLDKKLAEIDKEIESAEDISSSAQQKISLIKVMRDSENTRYEQLCAKLDANETLIGKIKADYEELKKEREIFESDRKELAVKLFEIENRIKEIGAARASMDVKRNEVLDKKQEVEEKITSLLILISEIRKDIETEERLSEEAGARIEGFAEAIRLQSERIDELYARIEGYKAAQLENRRKYSEGTEKLNILNAKRSKVEEGNSEFESKLAEVNAKMRDKRQYKENIFKDYTRLENRLLNLRAEQDKLSSRLWEDYELTRNDAAGLGYPTLTAETRAEAATKQTECRNKLRVLGNVDLDAVNKYTEVKRRYDEMSLQINDLNAARDELLSVIDKLEGEMKVSFVEAFNKINENFNRTFSELFGGGAAEISLTDPDNVLESGIEIKAAPPGKIIKNMVQLSGGEQAFIAIALFFAILQVNPTPFCILDEIEAALDEVNVVRLAEYIKRYSGGTQFVMITHRRGTMEAANRLYGVTMPERGISKVLELDVNEISKKKGEDWDGIFGQA